MQRVRAMIVVISSLLVIEILLLYDSYKMLCLLIHLTVWYAVTVDTIIIYTVTHVSEISENKLIEIIFQIFLFHCGQ